MLNAGCWYEGGWSCHHIDDLHPSEDRLPSLAALREHSVSSLFAAAVSDDGNTDHVEESGITRHVVDESSEVIEDVEELVDVDDSEASAQSAEMTAVEPVASAVSAVTNARRTLARQALQYGRQVIENRCTADELLDVDAIIRNCIHSAMTMLKDKDSCRGRKTSRLQMLLSLLQPESTEQQGSRSSLIWGCS